MVVLLKVHIVTDYLPLEGNNKEIDLIFEVCKEGIVVVNGRHPHRV
jgi:hypothetical protein